MISKMFQPEHITLPFEILVMILIREISPEECCFANVIVYSISRLRNFLIVFCNAKFIQLGTQQHYFFHTYKMGIVH